MPSKPVTIRHWYGFDLPAYIYTVLSISPFGASRFGWFFGSLFMFAEKAHTSLLVGPSYLDTCVLTLMFPPRLEDLSWLASVCAYPRDSPTEKHKADHSVF